MNTQIITTPAEDAADIATVRRFNERLASGQEELVPAAIVDRLVAGENAIRVWREHRGLSARSLAEKAGIAQAFLSQIETGKRDGTVATLKKIADTLSMVVSPLAKTAMAPVTAGFRRCIGDRSDRASALAAQEGRSGRPKPPSDFGPALSSLGMAGPGWGWRLNTWV